MTKQLILTDSPIAMLKIATAFADLSCTTKHGKITLSKDELETKDTELAAVLLNGVCETSIYGNESIVKVITPSSFLNSKNADQIDVSELTSFIRKEKINRVYMCIPKTQKNALLFKTLIADNPKDSFFLWIPLSMEHEDIRYSFDYAKEITDQEDFIERAVNISKIEKTLSKYTAGNHLSLSEFTLLALLLRRRDGLNQPRYMLKGTLNIEDAPDIPFVTLPTYNEKKAVDLASGKFQIKRVKNAQLRFPGLCELYQIFSKERYEKGLIETSLNTLYQASCITNPYALSIAMHPAYKGAAAGRMISAVKKYDTLPSNAKKLLTHFEHPDADGWPLTPIKTLSSASDTENLILKALSENIASRVKEVRNIDTNVKLIVDKIGPIDGIADSPVEGLTITGYKAKHIKNGTFQLFKISELLSELLEFGDTYPESYLSSIDKLLSLDFIHIENGTVDITDTGIDVLKRTSPSPMLLLKLSRTAFGRYRAELVDKYLSKIEEDFKALPEDAPIEHAPEAETSVEKELTFTSCPYCFKQRLYEFNDEWKCLACSRNVPKELSVDGYTFEMTPSRTYTIIKKGKSPYVVGSSPSGKKAGFLVMKNDKLHFTDKTSTKCPHCKSLLLADLRGLACSSCKFVVPFTIHGHTLTQDELKLILDGKPTGRITGLVKDTGEKFDASLELTAKGTLLYHRGLAKENQNDK